MRSSLVCRLGWYGALVAAMIVTTFPGTARATQCGSGSYPFPFTDVGGVADAFCKGILEAYVLGVTRGTSATTFGPNQLVDRMQMATFLQRSIDQGLRRSNRRMALGQWWTSTEVAPLQKISLPGSGPVGFCKSDGERIWVGNGRRVQSVLARTGELEADLDVGSLGFNDNIGGILVANGRLVVVDPIAQAVTRIIPSAAAPYGIFVSYQQSYAPNNLIYDGARVWTANYSSGSIAIISVVNGAPMVPGTVVGGFTSPIDVVYDGSNVWVAEAGGANRIRKLDANGAVLQTVPVGAGPAYTRGEPTQRPAASCLRRRADPGDQSAPTTA